MILTNTIKRHIKRLIGCETIPSTKSVSVYRCPWKLYLRDRKTNLSALICCDRPPSSSVVDTRNWISVCHHRGALTEQRLRLIVLQRTTFVKFPVTVGCSESSSSPLDGCRAVDPATKACQLHRPPGAYWEDLIERWRWWIVDARSTRNESDA